MSVNPTLIVALLLVSGGFLMAQDSATPAAADAPAAAPQSEMQKWIATTDEKWQALFKRDVTDVHLTELEKLKQQYVASLEAAVTKASGAGDLDGAVALRNEEKRFAGTNLFPEQDEATDAATVKQIRAAVRAQIAKLEKDTAARTKALHAKYDAVLGDAQARLTKVQRLEDALLVKAKREEVAAAWLAGIPAAPLQSTLRRADAASAADDPLDTLAQQAPNAIAWVLAPLNAAVPPDIRQNVTFLREGMLDDSAKTPKASLDAYKSGEQLCNTMIAALDERDRALAKSGFRALEAQTRTGIASEALDAKRNYKMSWPQFTRELTQRNELKSQANNNAAVIAERPKLEWSQRADQIRPTLDTLYKQFREALRKSPGRQMTTIAPSAPPTQVSLTNAPPVSKQIGTGSIEGKLSNTTWHWSGKQNITFLPNDKATWTFDQKAVLDWRVKSEADRTIEGHTAAGRPFSITFDADLQTGSLREDRFAPRVTTRIAPNPQPSTSVTTTPSSKLKIVSATYGSVTKTVDITEHLRKVYESGEASLKLTTRGAAEGRDPDRLARKQTVITYEIHGKVKTKTFEETSNLNFKKDLQ